MKTQLIASLSVATIGMLLGFSTSAKAFDFGTNGIQFDRATTVNFTFLKSQGKAISSLGVFDATGTTLLKTLFAEKDTADVG